MEKKSNLSVMGDASEIVYYKNASVPLYVARGDVSRFSNMEMLCHWHEDVEFVKVISGHMIYDINGKKIRLSAGGAVLINSKQMHYGYSDDKSGCVYYCVLFQTQLLAGNESLQRQYVEPITQNRKIQYTYLNVGRTEDKPLVECFDRIYTMFDRGDDGFELKAISELASAWAMWYKRLSESLTSYAVSDDRDVVSQKTMVQFIYEYYPNKVTLADIAKSGGVCKSKCCQIFKKYLGKSPIDFLSIYRLEMSLNMLRETKKNITEISCDCGFNSSSYYAETFMKYKGCSPREFRDRLASGGEFAE